MALSNYQTPLKLITDFAKKHNFAVAVDRFKVGTSSKTMYLLYDQPNSKGELNPNRNIKIFKVTQGKMKWAAAYSFLDKGKLGSNNKVVQAEDIRMLIFNLEKASPNFPPHITTSFKYRKV